MQHFHPRPSKTATLIELGYNQNVVDEVDLLHQLEDYLQKAGDPRTALLNWFRFRSAQLLTQGVEPNENHDRDRT